MNSHSMGMFYTFTTLIKLLNKTLILLFFLLFSQLALSEEAIEELEHNLAKTSLPQEVNQEELLQSDEEILKSLDDFGDVLTDDINLIEDDELLPYSPQSFDNFGGHDSESNNMLSNDSFDDLDLDSILSDELIENNEMPGTDLQEAAELSSFEKLGVGVDGTEEELINKLDKSNLMDFDKNIDIWDKEIINNDDGFFQQDDLDDSELELLESDEVEFIDDIEGDNFEVY